MIAPQIVARGWVLPAMTGTRMTANDRPNHWAVRNRITQEWRTLAAAQARAAGIPRLHRALIVIHWLPYDRRIRDAANAAPMGKACVDGIAIDAGVLVDDDSAHLAGPYYEIGEPVPRPAPCGYPLATLRITVTEVTG
jgi:hypothetical protein